MPLISFGKETFDEAQIAPWLCQTALTPGHQISGIISYNASINQFLVRTPKNRLIALRFIENPLRLKRKKPEFRSSHWQKQFDNFADWTEEIDDTYTDDEYQEGFKRMAVLSVSPSSAVAMGHVLTRRERDHLNVCLRYMALWQKLPYWLEDHKGIPDYVIESAGLKGVPIMTLEEFKAKHT